MNALRLELPVFIAGAVVMAVEIAGSRILAPYLGTSLYVWTSLIGIVLACLSFGAWWGGRLADRYHSFERLSLLLTIAGLLVAVIVPLNTPVLLLVQKTVGDLRAAALIAAVGLFAAPAILLGTITPLAVRLKMVDVERSGSTVGTIYAVSTLGSILGTFSAGFLLLAFLGTMQVILLLALCLVVAALLAEARHLFLVKLLLAVAIILFFFQDRSLRNRMSEMGLIDVDTTYQRVFIVDTKQEPTNRPIRYLMTDPSGSQSAMFLDAPQELAGTYMKYFRLARHFQPDLKRALLLGGGAYSFPKFLLANYPETSIDVVEIDPGLTYLAKKFFHLQDNPRLSTIHQDARVFLRRNTTRYDAIYLDVFSSAPTIPFQLATLEATQELFRALDGDGVLIVNVISAIEGEAGRFFRSYLHTLRAVFPQTLILPVEQANNPRAVQNVILVAFPKTRERSLRPADDELRHFMSQKFEVADTDGARVFLDSFAPVEYLMLPALLDLYRRAPGGQ